MRIIFALMAFVVAADAAAVVVWDKETIASPRSWPVEDAAISNDYGRINGVFPIWIEGEPYLGRPTRIFSWWGLPRTVTATRKVPAMVLVHGGGGTALASWVKDWNDRGYAAIALDTCGGAPRGEKVGQHHPRHEWSGPYGWQDSRGYDRGTLKDEWPYQAVSAVMRCHSFLRARPEVDAAHIGLTGISWGGYLTSIVMGVDDRFAFAAPVYGCGWYDMNTEWEKIFKDWNWNVEKKTGTLARLDYGRWLRDWDACNFISGTKCPVLRCNGTRDFYYTAEMTERSSAALPTGTVSMLSIKNPMPHGHAPAGDPKEIAAWADYFLKGGAKPLELTGFEFKDATFDVRFRENDDKAVAAQFLFTTDSCASNKDREWCTQDMTADDLVDGRVSFEVPDRAKLFFVNIHTVKGEVYSTRLFSNANERCVVADKAAASFKYPVTAVKDGRENIEWSTAYAYNVTDERSSLPRVLLIGDSITAGYQGAVAKKLEGRVNVTYWASSYGVNSPMYWKLVETYLTDLKYDAVHFCPGTHSYHATDAEIETGARRLITLIREKQPQAKLIWCSKTPVTNEVTNAKSLSINRITERVAMEEGIEWRDDLYLLMKPCDHATYWRDPFHFKPAGIDLQAEQVAQSVLVALGHIQSAASGLRFRGKDHDESR